MRLKTLRNSILFMTLALFILTSCQQQTTAEKAADLRNEISKLQQQLFENRTEAMDLVKADSMIMLYKKYAITYSNDTLAVDYLFKAAEVEMGVNKNEDCIATLTLIQNKYPDNEIIPMVLHFKAFVYDDKFEDFDKARATLDELIENYPNNSLIENAKAYRNMIGKDPAELFEKADSAAVVN
jgi:tetratricopeptide (TPR) repeat protein